MKLSLVENLLEEGLIDDRQLAECQEIERDTGQPLDKVLKTDGKIRVVYKDWPILTKASIYGAKLALAAKYQGKYEVAHRALMGVEGGKVSEERMRAAVAASTALE